MLVRARLAGLLIMIKVKIDNKEACAKLAIRSHYLKQLQSTLKLFFYHTLAGLRDCLCYVLRMNVTCHQSWQLLQCGSKIVCFLCLTKYTLHIVR